MGATGLIDQDIGLDERSPSESKRPKLLKAYPFKITVDHSLTVHVDQTPRDIPQLPKLCLSRATKGSRSFNCELTRSNRFSSGWAFTNLLMFPFSIHPDTIANLFSVIVTPSSGNTFGCRRALQVMASLQNFYKCPFDELTRSRK